MKFSIIMPTFNDEKTIVEAIDSVVNQTYQNWELIISIDGSTDNTEKVLKKYIKEKREDRIRYFKEENQDQLNAILNVCQNISGDYVYILHSDDALYDEDTLQNIQDYLNKNKELDAIISNIYTMNKNSIEISKINVKNYEKKDYIIPRNLLWLGRNQYMDTGFYKKSVFLNQVKENYLIWNTPFWLDLRDKPKMLNVKKVDFPVFKYRVFEGNYINNEIGKLNVMNGELRCATRLLKYYDIPFYNLQYYIFRIFNKINLEYKPFYKEKESTNKGKIIEFIVKKRYTNDEILKYPYLNSIISFYKNYHEETIKIKDIDKNAFIFYGKDMRKFNKEMLKNNLPKHYVELMEKMNKGFNKILVNSKEEKKVIETATKFLNIWPYVCVEVEKK